MNNIYQRTCPQCAAGNSTSATHCRCGYAFTDPSESEDNSLQEEQLYADYLAARAKQAAEVAIRAQSVHKADPNDAHKAAEAAKAIATAEEARKALMVQTARVNSFGVRVSSSAPPQQTSVASPKPQAAARPIETQKKAPIAMPRTPTPSPRVNATQPVRQPASRPVRTTTGGPQFSEPTKDCPICTAQVAKSSTRCGCGYSFEPARLDTLDLSAPAVGQQPGLHEARRAQQAAEAAKRAEAEAAGRARLAREAERVAQRIEAQKPRNCPHCTAIVAGGATQCACGYVFPVAAAPLMPSLSLDMSDLSQIDRALKPKPK